MGQAIGVLIGIVLLMMLFSFFAYFSGFLGLVAAAAVLVGGSIIVSAAATTKLAWRIFSSRGWALPIAGFAIILTLSPLLFEGDFCRIQSASGTASDLFNLPGASPGQIYSSSLEGQCLADGGLVWAMQQPSVIVRALLGLGGLWLFVFAFSGRRERPAAVVHPSDRFLETWTTEDVARFKADTEARLKVPAVFPRESRTLPSEMHDLLWRLQKLNGGWLDKAMLRRISKEPAFGGIGYRKLLKLATLTTIYFNIR